MNSNASGGELGTNRDEAEYPPGTSFLQLCERFPARDAVWTRFVNIDSSAFCLLVQLSGNSRILKGDIKEINRLVMG
jgi:hypothetical protein